MTIVAPPRPAATRDCVAPRWRQRAARVVLLTAGLSVSLWAGAASRTYTTTADFNEGVSVGISTADGKLALSITGSTFPVLWVANAGEDSLSKFDTRLNKEVARYRTWFGPSGQPGYTSHLGDAYSGAAPSRTAVDVDGNAYVLNRHFDGKSATLIKILSNSFIDRNGNGVADTSADANSDGLIQAGEMMALADTNGNGIIVPSEIQDERIAWAVRVPDGGPGFPIKSGFLGRSLCIAPNGELWVGLYNENTYYRVRASDGKTLQGPINVGITPYGCLIDSAGKLWSSDLGSNMGRLDTVTGTASPRVPIGGSHYGIALDNNYVYLGNYSGATYTRVNKATNAWDQPAAARFSVLGLSVDGTGAIVTGGTGGGDGVTRFNAATGAVICTNVGQGLSDARGVIADADNNVWVISLFSNRIAKYGPDCSQKGTFPVGNSPYTYSDAAGLAARSITTRSGDWNVVYDGGVPGIIWGQVSWNALVPAGASVLFSVRTADSVLGLGAQSFADVGNGSDFSKLGRFIEVRARLAAATDGGAPQLNDVTVSSSVCDVDGNLRINKLDIDAIMAARGQTALPGDVRDADGNGVINVLDARKCALRCTNASCAP
jgi:streptogramin lyase